MILNKKIDFNLIKNQNAKILLTQMLDKDPELRLSLE